MDTFISSSNFIAVPASVAVTELSSSLPVINSTISGSTTPPSVIDPSKLSPQERKALHWFKKGNKIGHGNRGKIRVSLIPILSRRLKKKQAQIIVDKLITDACNGNQKAIEKILNMLGDLDNKPTVNVTQNSSLFSPDILDSIRQSIANKKAQPQISFPVSSSVIEIDSVPSTPISASTSPNP